MFGAIAGGIASALAGGAMSKLFGGGQKAASGGIQGDVLATDNNTVGMGDAGIKSAIQGSNVPNPDEAVPSFVSGAMAKAGKGLLEGTLQAGTSAVSDKLLDLVGLGGKSAADKERILVIILLLHFLSLMLGSVLVLMLPLLVWLTPDLRIKKSLLKCNWTIRKRLPRCKMRLKKRLLAFSRRLHARIRKTRYMHKMRCLLINRGVYCSRCVYYGKHQSFQATAGFRDYAPNAYSSSNGWSVFYQ